MAKIFKKEFRVLWLIAVFLAILVPIQVHAERPTMTDIFTGGWWGDSETGLLACDGQICSDFCQILDLINNLVYFGLTILIYVIAPIRIVIGGFLIMTSAQSERLSKGKSMIKSTAIGIAIALLAFVIVATFLWVIGNNAAGSGEPRVAWPEIACAPGDQPFDFELDRNLAPDDLPDDVGQPGDHDFNLAWLNNMGINVWSSGVIQADCTGMVSCTSLQDLPESAIIGLAAIKNGCDAIARSELGPTGKCNLTVTAGTEVTGHETHGPGRAIVDIEDTNYVNRYIWARIGTSAPQNKTWYRGSDGFNYFWESNPSHWHICFVGPCYSSEIGG